MNDVLIEYIQTQLLAGQGHVNLSPEDDLLGSGLVDSLGMIQLLAFIEEKFEIQIPPQDMTIENFMSVEDISQYLSRLKAA